MNNLIISLSGIRAIVGESFGEKEAHKASDLFFGVYLERQKKPRKIIIGKDIKPTGDKLLQGAVAALYKNGIETVVNLGITTLPIIEWAVKHFDASGGIFITASHNPIEYNGIKFISSSQDNAGILSASFMQKIKDEWENKQTGKMTPVKLPEEKSCLGGYNKDVIENIKKVIDICAERPGKGNEIFSKLKENQPKIALDACSKDGLKIPATFLLSLGIKEKNIYPVNAETLSRCKRRLEPSPAYLGQLKEIIRKHDLDIGFAFDPDQDRLVIMPLSSEELTPILCAKFLLELQKNAHNKYIKQIPINLSTSSLWDELAKEYAIEIIRTRVGEFNVIDAMQKNKLSLGAEGNGGIILKDVSFGRNSTVGMALILAYIVYSGKSVKQLESLLPEYFMVKDKINVSVEQEKMNEFLTDKINIFTKQNKENIKSTDERDGYKIIFEDGSWAHIRVSNTEPMIRLIAESKDKEKAKMHIMQLKSFISKSD
ncbi:MAG: hypothetical protein PHW62_04675 [Candidatus Ratteibacteria bacterium]|nr:hypothetical protein [Candidatus Ratteibacteria bacterium]